MRRMLLALAGSALTAGVLAAPSLSAGKSVRIGDNYFVRHAGHATVTIRKGESVTWHWTGEHQHSVKVMSGPQKFFSGIKGHGASFSHTFTRTGTYSIYCTVHGPSMSMRVKVD